MINRTSTLRAVDSAKNDLFSLMDMFDFQKITRQVETYGRKNPMALTLASVALGFTAGLLLRPKRHLSQEEGK